MNSLLNLRRHETSDAEPPPDGGLLERLVNPVQFYTQPGASFGLLGGLSLNGIFDTELVNFYHLIESKSA